MPMMARILSRQGFQCTVLFAIDPAAGTINPQIKDNIPGLDSRARLHEQARNGNDVFVDAELGYDQRSRIIGTHDQLRAIRTRAVSTICSKEGSTWSSRGRETGIG